MVTRAWHKQARIPSCRSVSRVVSLWVSPISLWEVMLLAEKGKIALSDDPAAWIKKSLDALQILEAPLTGEIAILSRQIDLPHQDPADRFIAATALHYGFQLATVNLGFHQPGNVAV